jgi:hypothetical protein
VTGTSSNRRWVQLQSIFDVLGEEIASAIPGFHAITGADTTGKFRGIGKKGALKVLINSPAHVISALVDLGKDNTPPAHVISCCEEFCCLLVCTKRVSASDSASLRWKKFRSLSQNQRANMLPPIGSLASAYLQCASASTSLGSRQCP